MRQAEDSLERSRFGGHSVTEQIAQLEASNVASRGNLLANMMQADQAAGLNGLKPSKSQVLKP